MNSLEFQLYDWLESHQTINNESDVEDDLPGEFIIHSFGRCDNGQSVYAKITGYTPSFYILIPDNLQNKPKHHLDNIARNLYIFLKSKENTKVFYKFKQTLIETQIIKLKNADGFTNNKEFYFIRLIFNNADGMKKYRYFFEGNDVYVSGLIKPVRFKL